MISPAYLVRRMMHTKRWGIINTNRTQTVAEHTAGVAILADQIAITRGLSESDHLALLRHCLYHDAFEVVTGDFPAALNATIRR
jgi:5'-deoxynucleotidase YfbR-like HD superfamily hydrolase